MPPRRVLNVVDMTPNKRGPVELQLLECARQSTERGVGFAAYFTGEAPDWFAHAMSAAGGTLGRLSSSNWAGSVLAACERERPEVVHFHFGPLAGMTEAAARGIAVVRNEHSFAHARPLEPARAVVRHWRTRDVRAFVAVSEYVARQTVRRYAVRRSRVRVVLNGTDLERFRPRPEDKPRLRRELLGLSEEHVVVTLAAVLAPQKRQSMAILAMPEILRSAPRVRLVIAGDGPDREALRGLIAKHALDGAVLLLTGDNDVAQIYAASDIALQTSDGEGIGGAAIEALACGLPLLAAPNGGIVEVYEEPESGLSLREQSSRGIAQAVLALAADPARRERMGLAGRRRAEALFSVARAAAQTLAVYDDVLG